MFEATLGADAADLLATLANVRAQLSRFDGETFEANLGLDSAEFQATLLGANRSLSEFAGETYSANLGADSAGFTAAIANARREGTSFAGENYEATIGARGVIQTAAEIKSVDTVADRLEGRDVTVDVNADENGIRSLSEGFKSLASNIRATGTVLSAAAIPFGIAAIGAGIPTVAALAASVSGLAVALGSGLVGATVAATGALGGLAGAFGLVAAPVALLLGDLKDYQDGLESANTAQEGVNSTTEALKNARDDLDSATRSLIASQRELNSAEQLEPLNQRQATLDLAEARDAASDALREYNRAVKEFGANSEEATDARRDLAQANLDLKTTEIDVQDTRRRGSEELRSAQEAVRGAFAQQQQAAEAVTTASRAATSAQVQLRQETTRLTPAQKALFDEYQRFTKISDTAFRGAENATARLGVSILQLAESYLPRLGRVSEDTIGALSRSFATFRNELAQPVEQAGITRYLQLIPQLTQTAATAAGRLGLALFNVFSRSLRSALPLTNAVGNLADEFLRWTESVRGQRAIDEFFADSVDMALRLLPVIEDLAAGFGNLVSALQRTGVVDQSVAGFSSLADSFERSTRAGGGLDSFLRSAKDLMPFVADAAKAVGGAILGIAQAAIGARAQGARLTVLQQVFRGIVQAAGPLQSLVVGTFRNLGPAIANLLPPLTRFFAVFAGSSGPLVAFVNTITRVLTVFNRLPPNIKNVIAQLVALRVILGGLGITALVAPLGRFASNMFLASRAAGKLKGPLGAAGGAAVASTGIFARLGGVVRAAGTGFLAFVRFAGPVGLILGTLATAAILVYKNWGRIKAAVQPVIGAFGAFIKQVRPAAQQLLPTLVKSLRAFAAGLLSAVAPGRTLGGIVSGVVSHFAEFVRNAAPPTIAALKAIKHWLDQNQPAIRAMGHVVGVVLVGAFKLLITPIEAAITAFRNAAGVIRSLVNLGRQVGQTITAAAKSIRTGFEGLPASLKEIGKDIVRGLINGILDMVPGVKSAVELVADHVPDWMRDRLDSKSPSRVMEKVGRDVGEGFARGIEGSQKRVQDATGKMISGGFAEMTSSWRDTLRKIQTGKEFDIGGDLDKADAPRAIWNALRAAGWIVRGNQIFHPDTPPSALPTPSSGGTSRSRGQRTGSMSAQQFSNLPDAQRFALAARGGLPAPPPGYSWAEDYSLVRDSFFSGARRSRSRPLVDTGDGRRSFATDGGMDRRLRAGMQDTSAHRPASANEMRTIMREAAAAQGKNIYAAAAAAGLDPRALRLLWDLLDKTMGSDFAFRNGMGAAPN